MRQPKRQVKLWVAAMIALTALLLGGGLTYAVTAITVPGPGIQFGRAEVQAPEHLTISEYELELDVAEGKVAGVKVAITNSDSIAHTCDIEVAVVGTTTGEGSVTNQGIAPGKHKVTVPIGPQVDIDGITFVNIVIKETG